MQHHPPRERNVMEHSQSIASYTFIHPLKTMFLRPKHHQHQLWIPSNRAIDSRYLCQVFAPFLRLDRFFSFYAPCMKKVEFWPGHPVAHPSGDGNG